MRLTVDLIAKQPQFINPLKDRELDLRGQRIPVIENLSATQDQFDTIDLSNNDLTKLESATVLKRLKMLLCSNNKLARVAHGLGAQLPALSTLVLCNNDFGKLSDLDNLRSLRSLRALALCDNPVTKLPEYRLYVLHLVPQLRSLDFQTVKRKEVDEAIARFGAAPDADAGASAADEAEAAAGSKRAREAEDEPRAAPPPPPKMPKAAESALPAELVAAAREALASADSLEQVQRLERALKSRNADALRAVLYAASPAAAE